MRPESGCEGQRAQASPLQCRPSSAEVLGGGASCQGHGTLRLCTHVCLLCAHTTHTQTTSSLSLLPPTAGFHAPVPPWSRG